MERVNKDKNIITGGINDINSKIYGKSGIPKKYIEGMDTEVFLNSNFFGDFLGEVLNRSELLSKNFNQLKRKFPSSSTNHIWNSDTFEKNFYSIIQDYFSTNVEEYIKDSEEKKFIISLNTILVDKLMSPNINGISGKTHEIVVEKNTKIYSIMGEYDRVVEESAESDFQKQHSFK